MTSDEVELKGGMFTFMSLRLNTDDLEIIGQRLAEKVQQAPGFFRDSPVVVDFTELENLPDLDLDVEALLACIREQRLLPIVASVADKSSQLAAAIALPLVEGRARHREDSTPHGGTGTEPQTGSAVGQSAELPAAALHAEAGADNGSEEAGITSLLAPAEVEVIIKSPMLITRPVRSGQQIYARDTDLIIMGQVGPGAEVVADNNIHVYGPLRGRALCGVSGNTETRIFCQSLEAELVSVAGNFRVLESIPEDLRGKPAQIWLDKGKLTIETL